VRDEMFLLRTTGVAANDVRILKSCLTTRR
jgi:hypothetical protein